MAWNDIFPIFSEEFLQSYRDQVSADDAQELERLFGVDQVIAPKPEKNVLSVSLFWKSVSKDREPTPAPTRELLKDPKNHGMSTYRFHPWLHYVQPILDSPASLSLAKERLGCPDYKVRVYLAADLAFLIDDLAPVCEIYLMKSSSVNFSPGGLWRFLACDNGEGVSTIIDSDLLYTLSFHIEAGEKMRDHNLGFWRYTNAGDTFEKTESLRYLPVWGSTFGVDSRRMNFNWNEMLRAFMWHSWKGSFSTIAKHPMHGNIELFGTDWTSYGYDEFFLMAAAYPRLAQLGTLTYFSQSAFSLCFPFDVEYVTWSNPDSILVHLPLEVLNLQAEGYMRKEPF